MFGNTHVPSLILTFNVLQFPSLIVLHIGFRIGVELDQSIQIILRKFYVNLRFN